MLEAAVVLAMFAAPERTPALVPDFLDKCVYLAKTRIVPHDCAQFLGGGWFAEVTGCVGKVAVVDQASLPTRQLGTEWCLGRRRYLRLGG